MSTPNYAAAILDTVEAFLDTCPDIPMDVNIEYGERATFGQHGGRPAGVGFVVTIGGCKYSVEVCAAK